VSKVTRSQMYIVNLI